MISCAEFIYAYNELFKFLDERYGYQVVENLWREIREKFLGNLNALVKEKGILGMKEYWERTLNEEDAIFEIQCNEDSFEFFMKECPSVKRALNGPGEYYPRYCNHCPALYQPIIEQYGFKTKYEIIDRKKGVCRFTAWRIKK